MPSMNDLEQAALAELLLSNAPDYIGIATKYDIVCSTLQRRCNGQTSSRETFLDLHSEGISGPPTVGKTLTAELLTEDLQSLPLPISAGELGTRAEAVQKRLSRIFERALQQKAIFFLDSADVLLEQFSAQDIHRNALFCVFLRNLEYLSRNSVSHYRPGKADRPQWEEFCNTERKAEAEHSHKQNERELYGIVSLECFKVALRQPAHLGLKARLACRILVERGVAIVGVVIRATIDAIAVAFVTILQLLRFTLLHHALRHHHVPTSGDPIGHIDQSMCTGCGRKMKLEDGTYINLNTLVPPLYMPQSPCGGKTSESIYEAMWREMPEVSHLVKLFLHAPGQKRP